MYNSLEHLSCKSMQHLLVTSEESDWKLISRAHAQSLDCCGALHVINQNLFLKGC